VVSLRLRDHHDRTGDPPSDDLPIVLIVNQPGAGSGGAPFVTMMAPAHLRDRHDPPVMREPQMPCPVPHCEGHLYCTYRANTRGETHYDGPDRRCEFLSRLAIAEMHLGRRAEEKNREASPHEL
jgi:hypothetical protein